MPIKSTLKTLAPKVARPITGRWEQMFRDPAGLTVVRGWAFDPADIGRPVAITVYSGDEVVAQGLATERREDLVARGKGDGLCAFTLHVGADRLGRGPIRVVADGAEMPRPDGQAQVARPAFQWMGAVTRMEAEGQRLLVRGWVADLAHRSSRPAVCLDLGSTRVETFADLPSDPPRMGGKGEGARDFAFDVALPAGVDPRSARVVLIDGTVIAGALRVGLRDRLPDEKWPPVTMTRGRLRGGMSLHRAVLRGWVEEEEAEAGRPRPLVMQITQDGEMVWSGEAGRLETAPQADETQQASLRPVGYRVSLPPLRDGQVAAMLEAWTDDGRMLPGFPLRRTAGDEYIGSVEAVSVAADTVTVTGWCVNAQRPYEPVTVEVFRADGALLSHAVASAPPERGLRLRTLHAPVGAYAVTFPTSALGSGKPTAGGLVAAPAGSMRSLPLSRRVDPQMPLASAADRQLFATPLSEHDGTIDRVAGQVLNGWMRTTDDPERMGYVDVFLDNAPWATVAANRFRQHLAHQHGDNGSYAFAVELSPVQLWQVPGKLSIRPRTGQLAPGENHRHDLTPGAEAKRGAVVSAAQPLIDYVQPVARRAGTLGRVSLVVLNRNGARLLERLFASIHRYNAHPDVEVIVVDHASDDGSAKVCADWNGRLAVRLLQRDGNYSFSESNNVGARHATGEVLILANNDARLCEDILPQIVDALQDPTVGVVSPALLDDVPDPGLELAGQPGPIQHLGVHVDLGKAHQAGVVPFETRASREWLGIEAVPIEVPAVTGAFMALRREDFLSHGGLSEAYFYGHEDIDLVMRLRRSGLRAVALNQLRALHLRAYSRGTMSSDLAPVRLRNREVFDARFGVWLRRQLATDRFARVGYWSGRKLRIAFVVTENDPATMAGDLFTARELALELSRQFPVDCLFIEHRSPELKTLDGIDVLISMRDDVDPRIVQAGNPAMLRVAWIRNWSERFAARPWTWDFDLIWASSEHAQAVLSRDLARPVELMPIATSPERFGRGRRDPALACDYCFTGSFWGFNREIMQNLDPAALPYRFAIYGEGWEAVPSMAPYARGPLPYDRMPDVYASTRIVIDDANHATKAMQSVNSRVFDALAAGCLVLTNGRDGAQAMFGDALPTYDSPQELEALLRRYLDDEPLRARTVAQLRAVVREKHSYARRAGDAWTSLARASAAPRIAIKIGAPRREVLAEWGDFHFADSLRIAFEAMGYRVRIDTLDQWSNPQSHGDDVVLVLRGLSAYKPLPHQVSLMWIISHPDQVSLGEMAQYDHVFVASALFAEQLRPRLRERVSTLLQCTDPARFNPEAGERDMAEQVLFVGNSRGQFRQVIRDALEADLAPAIYGTRWRGLVSDRFIRGENVPNTRLAHAYRAAGVVLNDHWDTMREMGFISNRVFDVLACGGRIVSDPVEGIEALFGDMVATYEGPRGLARAVEALRSEGPDAQAARDAFARRIAAEHSFAARASEIDGVIQGLFARAATGEGDVEG